ncbi:MAG: hypothetical protein LUQ65_11725 [Candidatus Helarchaeota archaeon]|nr:hypothetical protein [Candidatus Helarchaeota archaeon]
MSAGRIVGGILALVAGVLLLIGVFVRMVIWSLDFSVPFVLPNIIIAALMMVGGILGLARLKTVGGILALVAGVVSIIGGLLLMFTSFYYLLPLSLISAFIMADFTYFFALEAFIAIVGGIILLVSSKE